MGQKRRDSHTRICRALIAVAGLSLELLVSPPALSSVLAEPEPEPLLPLPLVVLSPPLLLLLLDFSVVLFLPAITARSGTEGVSSVGQYGREWHGGAGLEMSSQKDV